RDDQIAVNDRPRAPCQYQPAIRASCESHERSLHLGGVAHVDRAQLHPERRRHGLNCALDRDLYPFCFRIADGKLLVSPKAVQAGTDIRTLKDTNGNGYGPAIYAAAQKPEGEITEVPSYMFPKPGTTL